MHDEHQASSSERQGLKLTKCVDPHQQAHQQSTAGGSSTRAGSASTSTSAGGGGSSSRAEQHPEPLLAQAPSRPSGPGSADDKNLAPNRQHEQQHQQQQRHHEAAGGQPPMVARQHPRCVPACKHSGHWTGRCSLPLAIGMSLLTLQAGCKVLSRTAGDAAPNLLRRAVAEMGQSLRASKLQRLAEARTQPDAGSAHR